MKRYRGRLFLGAGALWLLVAIAHSGWRFFGPVAWFGSALGRTVFVASFLIWIATEFAIAWRSASPRDPAVRRRDRGTLTLVVVAIWLAVWLQFQLRILGVWVLPPIWYAPGIVLLVLGILLRLWAVRTLGRFFSTRVEIREGHRLVRTGPYRWIRHPAYTGSLLSITGLALALRSGGGLLASLLLAGGAFLVRMAVEERALEEELGDRYAEYRRSTWRLFPGLF